MLVQRQIRRRRAAGPLSALEALLVDEPVFSTTVIGQTCWATHGERCRRNARPHASARVAIVHAGVVENHAELRAEIEEDGVQFRSETDSEIIVWLLNRELADGANPMAAMQTVLPRLEGSYALALICARRGGRVYAAQKGIAFSAARSANASWLSTDETALRSFAEEMVPLQDGQIAELTPGRVRILDSQLEQRPPRWQRSVSTSVRRRSEQGMSSAAYAEILGQPAMVGRVLRQFEQDIASNDLERWCGPLWRAKRLLAVGSGMSHHAAHVGRTWLERIGGIPVEVELSSELEVRKPVLEPGTMALLVSHGGEDNGALAALAHLKERGVPTVVLTNAVPSRVAREADAVLDGGLGQDIGTAYTRGFVAQLGTLAAASIAMHRLRNAVVPTEQLPASLLSVPGAMRAALDVEAECAFLGQSLAFAGRAVYLGRGVNHPLARMGALQLEISSGLPATGLAGGELDHSAVALGEARVPVVLVAPQDETFDRTLSDAKEVMARGGKPMLLGDARSASVAIEHDIPSVALGPPEPVWAPLVLATALQLVAYHAGVARHRQQSRPSNDVGMTATGD
jgi:glucosamine--fructose-6-phosphate aminotransferase (isomerizing)